MDKFNETDVPDGLPHSEADGADDAGCWGWETWTTMIMADETGLSTWHCPDCGAANLLFLVQGEALPETLECAFCDHASDPINWIVWGTVDDTIRTSSHEILILPLVDETHGA